MLKRARGQTNIKIYRSKARQGKVEKKNKATQLHNLTNQNSHPFVVAS